MDLMIDIGNSLIKYAGFVDNQIQFRGRCDLSGFRKSMGELNTANIDRVVVSSVKIIPKTLSGVLESSGLKYTELHNLFPPIVNKYQSPNTLGSDRLALAAGGVRAFPEKAVLIIDLGTCMTFDLIDCEGAYLGGSISLGLQMRLKALHTFTAKLPLVKLSQPKDFLGKNTNESILSGAVIGMEMELKGTIDAYKTRYPKIKIILTGGDAPFFDKKLKNSIFADPDLLLKGMNFILTQNESKKS